MAEARDRLVRPEDVAAVFARQRRMIRENQIYVDEPERSGGSGRGGGGLDLFGSPAWRREAATPARRRVGGFGRGRFGTPRSGSGRRSYGSPVSAGRENLDAGGSVRRFRGSGSSLPSWYPRTPLRDITHIVRAIEKRRAYMRERESQQTKSPLPSGPNVNYPSASSSRAPRKDDPSLVTPMPLVAAKSLAAGKVPQILLEITNQNAEESELLTPQKKLLNSIDMVEKVVTEELQKQKRTPSARRAERDRRVRTLMSMR